MHELNKWTGCRCFFLAFICTILVPVSYDNCCAQNVGSESNWQGKLKDGRTITQNDLDRIIEKHNRWLKTDGKEGEAADLSGANLSRARLGELSLKKIDLRGADLAHAGLRKTDLSWAMLNNANLTYASMSEVNLFSADLSNADLSHATVRYAKFAEADLRGAKLTEADVRFSDFANAYFEPVDLRGLVFIGSENLSDILFINLSAVIELRRVAKESGLRNEERSLTAAIRKYRFNSSLLSDQIFEFILIDLPTDFGSKPWRSIRLLVILILIFSPLYYVSLVQDKSDGIWRVWIEGRVRKDIGDSTPIRLHLSGFQAIRTAFYFSILAAFSVGWRELNVGNWIARIQGREFTLVATGWTRTISGVHSLLSVYLLALWVITYFGRPFE